MGRRGAWAARDGLGSSSNFSGAEYSAGAAASAGSNERAIELPLTEAELGSARPVPVKRGQVTMHDEWIVHGSGGNAKATPRKTYVVAYRDAKMVAYERSIGFSHSYNDDPDVLRKVRAGEL